ncbi:hypothetical protein HRM2_05780 [Desulforapulum autotrophicum HRM2]|uniref:Uncharacterized protein n=1 Tax=Desulforapulum autotrophicum (strain ATCC 43914 / DSM 3382 / VKM B-1955 / HRM2) TaxID=177437 RepID=C0QIQ2_DESAH|nr:hypothetical protein [Desulforapulum autotrophicum]ACN13692.1 hypothetical protein HRM2_05780 [Desulforapulum autotrophicum HRM2]
MYEAKKIEQKVNATLGRLAELEDIDVHPFLHAHLEVRIREYEENKAGSAFLRFHMRDLRPAVLLLLLGFNLAAGIFTVHTLAEQRESNQTAFAEEYILTRETGDVAFIL